MSRNLAFLLLCVSALLLSVAVLALPTTPQLLMVTMNQIWHKIQRWNDEKTG